MTKPGGVLVDGTSMEEAGNPVGLHYSTAMPFKGADFEV